MKRIRSVVRGCGSYLPKKVVTNSDLAKIVDTSDDWIVQRTGIQQRYIAAEHETTSFLGVQAAKRALEHADLVPEDIDLLICATSTPDYTFPAAAAVIQAELGIRQGTAFDVQAVCAGFVFAVATAEKFLRSGSHKRALVIGADTFSRILDWKDRTTCVLFGDGAGAIVLEAQETEENIGILSTQLRTDGRHRSKLYVDGGPGSTKEVGHLRMEGKEVFRFAVGSISDVVVDAFKEAGLSISDLDWFVPHQANKRIILASAEKLRIPLEKVVITVERYGNTSAATIPLALDIAIKDGRIKKGNLVLLEAIGGGFSWGSALIRW